MYSPGMGNDDRQAIDTPANEKSEAQQKRDFIKSLIWVAFFVAVVIGVLVAFLGGGGGESDSLKCQSLASDTLATGDAQFTEVDSVDNDGMVLGHVGQYRNGDSERVMFWHCEVNDGKPEIVWKNSAKP